MNLLDKLLYIAIVLTLLTACKNTSNTQAGIYYQNDSNEYTNFIFIDDKETALFPYQDFGTEKLLALNNQFAKVSIDNDTILYNQFKIGETAASSFDSIYISNYTPCSGQDCFVYDLVIRKEKPTLLKLYYPYTLQGNYEFELQQPFLSWINEGASNFNKLPPVNILGKGDTSNLTKSVMSLVLYNKEGRKVIYGNFKYFDTTTVCFYTLIQAILKKNRKNWIKTDIRKNVDFSRDTFNRYSTMTGIGTRVIDNPPTN